MTKNECPLGEDCDLLIAYEHGLSSARDIILQNGKLEAERDTERLAAELFATKDSAARVRLLSDKVSGAWREELEAERDDARMQSLAHLGQAQDAYEAQKKAEAENVKLREAMARACDLIDDVAEGKTGMGTPYRMLAAALQETEK